MLLGRMITKTMHHIVIRAIYSIAYSLFKCTTKLCQCQKKHTTQGVRRCPPNTFKHFPVWQSIILTVWSPLEKRDSQFSYYV